MFNRRAVAFLRLSSSSSSPWKRRQLPRSRCPPSASSSFSSSVSARRSSSSDDDRRIPLTAAAASDAAAADVAPCPVASSPDFYNTQVIYGARSSWEIVRSYFVFSLCSFDFIVDRQAKILSLIRRLLGRPLFVHLIKRTIFGQFMSSDDPNVILDLARRHSQSTVSPLFAYTAAEFHGTQTGGSPGGSAQNKSARDVWCQRNFDAILQGIATASRCKEFTLDKPVVTTKITFLTDYTVLRQLTEAINQQTKLIESTMIDSCQLKDPTRHRSLIEYLTTDVLQRKPVVDLSQLAPPGQVGGNNTQISKSSALQMSGLLTSVRFHLAFNQSLHEAPSPAATKIMNDNKLSVIKLSRDDIRRIVDVWGSMTKLNERASEADVFINYDAEQTFIQPAIESLVLDSMRIFNRQRPLVLNTYQCYLKRTFDIVKRDLEICDLEGFCFGGKVVRGAYMDEERRLARETHLPDPVNDNYEATTESYIRVLNHLLSRSAADKDTQPMQPQTLTRRQQLLQQRIIVATHNLDTVNFVIKQLAERKLDARNIGFSFAQLLGTRDYISFALGAAGYPAGKLIHYADPEDGLAYLSRRVQENRSGLPSPAIERRLLRMELKRRILRR